MADTTPAPVTPAPTVTESVSVPVPTAPAPESGQSEAVKPESADASPPEGQEGAPPEKPKRPASERIATLYAQKKQAEAEARAYQQEALRLRDQLTKLRDTPLDGLSHEQQTAAQISHAVKMERLEEQASAAQNASERAYAARADAFAAKVDAARDRMPDFDQVFQNAAISEVAAELIAESDRAPEIAYYLGRNPVEAQRIYRLPAHLQGAEIARIEARVAAPARKTSTAPPPVPTVAAVAARASAKDPANMSMAEYSEWYRTRQKRA